MKKRLTGFAVLVMVLFSLTSLSLAYDVTVKNDEVAEYVKVTLYISTVNNVEFSTLFIPKGGSVTFKTGGWCPSGLKGYAEPIGLAKTLESTNMYGHNSAFVAVCSGSSWKICRKHGTGTLNDNDFGFCKQ